jgi:hypothetical protein
MLDAYIIQNSVYTVLAKPNCNKIVAIFSSYKGDFISPTNGKYRISLSGNPYYISEVSQSNVGSIRFVKKVTLNSLADLAKYLGRSEYSIKSNFALSRCFQPLKAGCFQPLKAEVKQSPVSPQPANFDPTGGGYVIATKVNGSLSFSSKPKIHQTKKLAEVELNRLSSLYNGTEFYLLKIDSMVMEPVSKKVVKSFV